MCLSLPMAGVAPGNNQLLTLAAAHYLTTALIPESAFPGADIPVSYTHLTLPTSDLV